MAYIPTKTELKELDFIKKRDLGIYERVFKGGVILCFDFAIEQEHKFYVLNGDEESLLDFENKEEVEFFITTLLRLIKEKHLPLK